jgi:hypothetical protein
LGEKETPSMPREAQGIRRKRQAPRNRRKREERMERGLYQVKK